MGVFTYLAVLAACLAGAIWLEVVLRTRVVRRWPRLILTVGPVLIVFGTWDAAAIALGHWSFDPDQISGLVLPGGLPVEELLFFLVIPLCAILTLEAVRSVRGWPTGDEPPAECEVVAHSDQENRAITSHSAQGRRGMR